MAITMVVIAIIAMKETVTAMETTIITIMAIITEITTTMETITTITTIIFNENAHDGLLSNIGGLMGKRDFEGENGNNHRNQ